MRLVCGCVRGSLLMLRNNLCKQCFTADLRQQSSQSAFAAKIQPDVGERRSQLTAGSIPKEKVLTDRGPSWCERGFKGEKNPSGADQRRSRCVALKSGSVCSGANAAAQRRPGAGGDNDSAAARLCIVALCTVRAALIWSLCECVGNGAAFPVLWEKTLQRKMAGSLQGLLIRPLKVSQSTWECRVLAASRKLSNQWIRFCKKSLNDRRWRCLVIPVETPQLTIFHLKEITLTLLSVSWMYKKNWKPDW